VRRLGIALLLLAFGTASGCSGFPGRGARYANEPTTASAAWPSILVTAQTEVDRGRHADADRTLRQFAAEYPRTPEAIESTYWRAVFMLDPGNNSATVRDATQLLDRYLGTEGPLAHRTEATVLQRIARQLAAPRDVAPAVTSAPAPRPADPAREAEIKALKDELEQTKAELERIKKRVAPPPTPPPATPPPR
jgi:hypothetical protein